jgi:ribosome-binding ATPase
VGDSGASDMKDEKPMALQIGIVGLPNVGKSTLFNALTRASVPVASYPFTTIDPNVGMATVPDSRLEQIATLIQPGRVTPAAIEFVDIAGLVRGASRGEGLGNQFLGHIRNVDAVALVLRCFEDSDIPHQFDVIDPLLDLDTVNLELILADIATVERQIEKTRGVAKANPREYSEQIAFLGRLHEHLDSGGRAAAYPCQGRESEWLTEMNLLSHKPQLLVANVGEDSLPSGGALAQRVLERAARAGETAVVLCAGVEAELAQLSPDEADEFRAALSLDEAGLLRLARAGYRLLNLITFFTATGQEEVRAWPLLKGRTVWEAAGMIHTDMQAGFIRAEVVAWDQLVQAGSWANIRSRGHSRVEGRDYIVQDGDVVHIRFNV